MKIYSILVFSAADLKKLMSASQEPNWFSADPREDDICTFLDANKKNFVNKLGYHKLKISGQAVYYMQVTQDHLYAVAVDVELTEVQKRHLFAHIVQAKQKNDLENILKDPESATTDIGMQKIAAIQKELNETKDIMLENIDKVLLRGEKVEDLVQRTDELKRTAGDFEWSATRLKNKQRCPFFYSIFESLRSMVSSDDGYTYQPEHQSIKKP